MTVTSTTSSNQYTGTGTTGPFAYSFRITDATQLTVTSTTAAGVATTLVYLTDYTVANVGLATGSITTTAAVAAGVRLTIQRVPALTQTTSLRNQGAYYPAVVEDAFDYLMFAIQYVYSLVTTAIRLPSSVVSGAFTAIMPVTPASGYLRINAAGTAYEAVTNVNDPGTWTQSGTGAVSRTVTAKFGEVVSVKDFNAKGDGSTDDTAACQAALDSLAGVGGEVLFPAGRYYLASPLVLRTTHSGLRLRGAAFGAGSTLYAPTTLYANTAAVITATSGPNQPTVATPLYSVEFKDLGVTCQNGLSHDHLFQLDSIFKFLFDHCTWSGVLAGKDNVQLSNAVDTTFLNCYMAGAGRYGVNAGHIRASNLNTTLRLIGGYWRSCRDAGLNTAGQTVADEMQFVSVNGTLFEANGRDAALAAIAGALGCGIILDNVQAAQINAYFEGNKGADIVVGGTVDSATPPVPTIGLGCQSVDLNGLFNGSINTVPSTSYGVQLIKAVGVTIGGWFAYHGTALVRIADAGGTNVQNVEFKRFYNASAPVAIVNDAAGRIGVGVDPEGARFGSARMLVGPLTTTAPTAAQAGFSLPAGVSPAAPAAGDAWNDGTSVYVRIAGASKLGGFVFFGAGSPLGVVTASPGALYVNTAGGAGTTLYVKESGVGTTAGWVGK